MQHTRQVSLRIQSDRYLFYTPRVVDDEWNNTYFIKKTQNEGDLGRRMQHAFEVTLEKH